MVESGSNTEDTVDCEETISKVAKVFVSKPLHSAIALIGRVNRRKVRLQNSNELLRSFFGLRKFHVSGSTFNVTFVPSGKSLVCPNICP
jgi:hypothetical protein